MLTDNMLCMDLCGLSLSVAKRLVGPKVSTGSSLLTRTMPCPRPHPQTLGVSYFTIKVFGY